MFKYNLTTCYLIYYTMIGLLLLLAVFIIKLHLSSGMVSGTSSSVLETVCCVEKK